MSPLLETHGGHCVHSWRTTYLLLETAGGLSVHSWRTFRPLLKNADGLSFHSRKTTFFLLEYMSGEFPCLQTLWGLKWWWWEKKGTGLWFNNFGRVLYFPHLVGILGYGQCFQLCWRTLSPLLETPGGLCVHSGRTTCLLLDYLSFPWDCWRTICALLDTAGGLCVHSGECWRTLSSLMETPGRLCVHS